MQKCPIYTSRGSTDQPAFQARYCNVKRPVDILMFVARSVASDKQNVICIEQRERRNQCTESTSLQAEGETTLATKGKLLLLPFLRELSY